MPFSRLASATPSCYLARPKSTASWSATHVLSIYDASIRPLVRGLKNLSAIIDKAVTQAKADNIDPKSLLEARLAPDMHPFTRQVQIASDSAKNVGRLAGLEPPSYPDTESDFPALKARIEKTIAYLNSLPKEKFEGAESRKIEMKIPGRTLEFSGTDYLTVLVLPNFFFHVTTAYGLLRHNGIAIGKMDFLGSA
ncbi:MAG: DUF1993 domain-containing protein [Alphaproteobacteria bacterium]|nr:DUF1993 domain-containing protein [Alphaproteobacteria bacterium]